MDIKPSNIFVWRQYEESPWEAQVANFELSVPLEIDENNVPLTTRMTTGDHVHSAPEVILSLYFNLV
jgi:hypothetical protein